MATAGLAVTGLARLATTTSRSLFEHRGVHYLRSRVTIRTDLRPSTCWGRHVKLYCYVGGVLGGGKVGVAFYQNNVGIPYQPRLFCKDNFITDIVVLNTHLVNYPRNFQRTTR